VITIKITVIHFRNTFCIEYCKKTFLNPNIANFEYSLTVRNKISCQTHLEEENNSFKHIFGILIKFPIQYPEKTTKFGTVREKNGV